MSLRSMPPEIVDLMTSRMDRATLQQIRLVNKTWNLAASKWLFETVSMTPTIQGIERWQHVVHDPKIRQLVRKAIINSCPVPDWAPLNYSIDSPEMALMQVWNPNTEDEVYAPFFKAIEAIRLLPNLDHAVLQYTANCQLDDFDDELDSRSEIEGIDIRLCILPVFFKSLHDRVEENNHRAMPSLTIYNLQNTASTPYCLDDEKPHNVFDSVEELHLQICEAVYDQGLTDDICKERENFTSHLTIDWLMPMSSKLRELTLYFPAFWGTIPGDYFDGTGLTFPLLETMTLGRYCIAHRNDLKWILRQDSLRSLRLHNCAIASLFRIDESTLSDWKIRTHDWTELPGNTFGVDEENPQHDRVYHYAGIWAKVFTSIRDELHFLEDFRFHFDTQQHSPERQAWFGRPDLLQVQLSPQRYVGFKVLTWVGPEPSGELVMGWNNESVVVAEDYELKDQEALTLLLDQLSHSRELQ